MVTAVVVQARWGSTRLPGKVLKPLNGHTVLAEVLKRCSAVAGADLVVCALPDKSDSADLEVVARKSGASIFSGSEHDVLERYLGAARSVGADVVMRVTSDCPLIDPAVCDAVLQLRERETAAYAANNLERTFPHGLDCEAFTTAALEEAAQAARDAYDREHVTPWLRRAPHLKRANLTTEIAGLTDERWTLDYPDDLTFIEAVFEHLPDNSAGRMADVIDVLKRHPELRAINAHHRIS